LRIKKIYLKNFKGIKDKSIIDFKNQTSLLIGPNGFGKTTIFDALELCFTGEIHRTIQKGSVTNHRSDYKKLFFQNDENEDVIVKLWLEKITDDKSKELIITRYLPKEKEQREYKRGRKHKPDDFYLFKAYSDTPETFDADTFNPKEHSPITQKQIDSFFEFDSEDIGIKEVYNLFNYLQQEETTFFLKKSENKRRESLGFLFNTNNEERELQRISNTLSKLNKISGMLEEELSNYKKHQEIDAVNYTSLFPDENIGFDGENLFKNKDMNIAKGEKDNYFNETQKLSEFIKRFSPDEYTKKINVEFLESKIKDNNFVDHYILQKLLIEENYNLYQKDYTLINDTHKLKAFILKAHLEKYNEYKIINKNHEKYSEFLSITDFEKKINKVKEFVEKLMPDNETRFGSLIETRNQINTTSTEVQNLISEMIRLRNNLKVNFKQYTQNETYDPSCPYCGFLWKTYEEMDENFKRQEKNFKQSLDDQSNKRVKIEEEIMKGIINPISDKMKEYIKNNQVIDKKIIELLGEYQDKKIDFGVLNKYYSEKLVWKELRPYENIEESINLLKKALENDMKVSTELFEKMKQLFVVSYDEDVEKLKKIISEKELNKFVFENLNEQKTLNDLEVESEKLKTLFEEFKSRYTFEKNKTEDPEKLYEKYFQSTKEEFDKMNETKLQRKVEYIKYAFSQKQSNMLNVYNQRKERLDKIISRMVAIRKKIDNTIKNHKREMANNIKIPFYIYTAKILQNYQQGMGIFLSTKGESDAIRFLTDSSSDHDAIHHLSSGQLAVTSIAFALAINKTYNISDNLKFLTIDDPIQEMDSMNIHSFIELIRHEFLNDYQLIFSTHNDSNALFMKYKFEKINSEEVSLIDVQSEFFY